MKTLHQLGTSFACIFSLIFITSANASPIQLNLTGSVDDANGTRVNDIGTAVYADLIIDLDANNAYAYELISPAGEDPFGRWTFSSTPYQAGFSGNFGSFVDTHSPNIEIVDNFNADTNGNPYGLTGIVDVLSIFGGNMQVDCSNGTIHPVTGCDDPDAPFISGQEVNVNLVYNSNWFSGLASLPTSIPDFNSLIGVFGSIDDWENYQEAGYASVIYSEMTVTAVPLPASVWLFGSGLVALVGFCRRKSAA